VNKEKTIHTSRTIMFAELSRIMFHGISKNSFDESFSDNVAGKLSKSNQEKTNRYLKQLYGFDLSDSFFSSFSWFWKSTPESEHSLMAIIYAIKNDFLLSESIDVVNSIAIGNKVTIELLERNIQSRYPNRFSKATLRSIAQNIASSWKQAGFIIGKVKNIRVMPDIGYWTVSFALLIGYLEGMRGEFLLGSKYIRTMGLPEAKIRELITEASKRDILQYQYSGHVTTIMFPNLLKSIGIYGE